MNIKEFKLNYLYEAAGLSKQQREKRRLFADADGTDLPEFKELAGISSDMARFVESGESLYLHSPNCGNGKTSWALRLMQCYFEQRCLSLSLGCHGLFVSVPRYLREVKENISQRSDYIAEVRESVGKADLVIWDDIATKQASAFDAEQLLSLIDERIASGKANIYTSNLRDDELHLFIGDRLASRISGSTYNIELHGSDKRGIAK